jgi:hydroxymethylglutaryl-CoA reductase
MAVEETTHPREKRRPQSRSDSRARSKAKAGVEINPLTGSGSPPEAPSWAETLAHQPLPAKDKSQSFSSRLPGFYELPITERLDLCCQMTGLSPAEAAHLHSFGALSGAQVDVFIENAIGTYPLPLGIATNFHINGRDVLVPMAVEETSVLAAASHGAKLARLGGGFKASSTRPVMTGQIQIVLDSAASELQCLNSWNEKMDFANRILKAHRAEIIQYANIGQERLMDRGGGALDLDWHGIPEMESVVLHLHVDTRDAMGANIVNTMCERLGTILPEILPCTVGLRILTNLTDRRITRSSCVVPWHALKSEGPQGALSGKEVVDRIVMAYQFARYDVHRAATNNKGIMNGIDPVLIATGNDWRAIEAGAHSYAAVRSAHGAYGPMAHWSKTPEGHLEGVLELPMAVGVVGGVTKLHGTAKAALKLMGSPDANELAQIVVSVGLAQNLSALRALAAEGIQRGHMHLHQSNLELLRRTGRQGADQGSTPQSEHPLDHKTNTQGRGNHHQL